MPRTVRGGLTFREAHTMSHHHAYCLLFHIITHTVRGGLTFREAHILFILTLYT